MTYVESFFALGNTMWHSLLILKMPLKLQVYLDIDFTRFLTQLMLTVHLSPLDSRLFYLEPPVPHSCLVPHSLNHLMRSNTNVSQDLFQNLYVDNVVSGCQTETESLNYFTSSRSILGSASFNLCSWASNCAQLRIAARECNVAEKDNPVKVLGL